MAMTPAEMQNFSIALSNNKVSNYSDPNASVKYRTSTPANGGQSSYAFNTNYNNDGQILGEDKVAPSGGSNPNPTPAPAGNNNNNNNNNNGGDGRSEIEKQLDAWNNKWNKYYGELKGTLQGEADKQTARTRARGEKEQGRVKEDEASTLKDLGIDEERAMGTLDSATNDAIRAYNSLAQQGRSRFGLGSSAGAAVGELARKEFFRQQGDISGKRADTQLEFQREEDSLKKFTRNKVSDIADWINDSISGIESQLVMAMKDVEGKKMQSEQARDEAKLNLLQSAVADAQNQKANAQSMMQNLFLSYVDNLQTIQNRVFTPKEIAVLKQEFESSLPAGLNFSVDVSSTTPKVNYNYLANNDDEQNPVGE